MTARKHLVLAFIKRYFATHGESPTLGEIAEGANTNRTRVHAAVRRLELEEKVGRIPGKARGLTLPDSAERISLADALLRLRAAGYIVDEDVFRVDSIVTNTMLPPLPMLDHIAGTGTGGDRHGNERGRGQGNADDRGAGATSRDRGAQG